MSATSRPTVAECEARVQELRCELADLRTRIARDRQRVKEIVSAWGSIGELEAATTELLRARRQAEHEKLPRLVWAEKQARADFRITNVTPKRIYAVLFGGTTSVFWRRDNGQSAQQSPIDVAASLQAWAWRSR